MALFTPTLPLVVSTLNTPELILNAEFAELKVKAAEPLVEVKEIAPVERVNPFWAVSNAPAVIVPPAPVADKAPEVVTSSPELVGERVVLALSQKPAVPDDPVVNPPVQSKIPVESFKVQPVEPEPPPSKTSPVPPVVAIFMLVGPVITGDVPAKVKAVEVKVLVFMVEEKVAAPATPNVPEPVVEIFPEVVI